MQKPEDVLENGNHKVLGDFEIQADHLIPVRRPDLVIIEKKKKKKKKTENLPYCGLCCSGGPRSENQRKRKAKSVILSNN